MKLLDFSDKHNKTIHLEQISPEYIRQLKELVRNSSFYPRFHLAPPHGLMNDPNGLCQIDGWYHVFYQWFPLGPVHGLKYWYHLKTRDFIHYLDYGPALAPDSELDADGCFTGIAVPEGKGWYIYYTGVREGEQHVCRAAFDGENGIGQKELCIPFDPHRTSREFRDPFLYEGRWLLVGAQSTEGKGIVPVFRREGEEFVCQGILRLPEAFEGSMIECPNMIRLDGERDLFVFAPMGVADLDRYTCRNVFSVLYGIGSFDPDRLTFDCRRFAELDSGFDFYAPQIFRDEGGRLLLLGWLGNSKCVYPSDFEQWAHMMTLPREIGFEGDRIRQQPVGELKALRQSECLLEEDQILPSLCFELECEADEEFELVLYRSDTEQLTFRGDSREYCLDREKTSCLYNERYGQQRYARRDLSRRQTLRIFVDRSAIEIFAEDGFVVFTGRFYLDDIKGLRCKGLRGKLCFLRSLSIEDHKG